MKIEMIKYYIEKNMPTYNYLINGSVKTSWESPTIKGDEVWVEVTHSSYYLEKIVIDLIDLLAFIFEMNIDRQHEN